MHETESSPPWAKGRQAGIENNQLGASSQSQIIELETRRQALPAAKHTGSYQQVDQSLGWSYVIWRQWASIRRSEFHPAG
jgi:hypothetical protein